MAKPSIGRIVHYVVPEDSMSMSPGTHRPAIVTRIWSDTCVNLHVFADVGDAGGGVAHLISSVSLDESGKAGRSWHWPEREE